MVEVQTSETFYSNSNSREQDEVLVQPYAHFSKLCENGNKHNFLKILRSFNFWMKISEDRASLIENITMMLQETAILNDTFKESSVVGKEVNTVHSLYGSSSTINALGYVICVAFEKGLTLQTQDQTQDQEVVVILIQQCKEIYRGLMKEHEWSTSPNKCPTEEEYKKVCVSKLGSCFKMAAQMMQCFSENKMNFERFCDILGVFFSLYEDVIFLRSKEGSFGRIYRDYINRKKFNFPIIHAFRNETLNNSLLKIFQLKSSDAKLKDYFVASLDKIGSFRYTEEMLLTLKFEAELEMKKLGGNPYLLHILEDMLMRLNKIG